MIKIFHWIVGWYITKTDTIIQAVNEIIGSNPKTYRVSNIESSLSNYFLSEMIPETYKTIYKVLKRAASWRILDQKAPICQKMSHDARSSYGLWFYVGSYYKSN